MSPRCHIRIDAQSPVPAYRQIVDQLRVLIVEEDLHQGDLMPPVRSLARELGLHFNTVAEAYRTLAHEGLLEITQGRRARVPPRTSSSTADRRESTKSFKKKLREIIAEFQTKGLSAKQIARALQGALEGTDL